MYDIVDTHCHLDFEVFDQERREVLRRAGEAGVQRILNPGIDIASITKAMQVSGGFENVYFACGVHPNDSLSWNAQTLDALRGLANQPRVVAIGEIGLDYYRDRAPREWQKWVFSQQLLLAADLELPVVIHSRDSMHDILDMLSDWHAHLVAQGSPIAGHPGVLHSFSGNCVDAERAIGNNFFLGVTGPVTYQKNDDLRETLAAIPLTSLVVETDAPFLTPHPHRGKRNEPAYVRYIVEKLAEIQRRSLEEVAEATTANSRALFSW